MKRHRPLPSRTFPLLTLGVLLISGVAAISRVSRAGRYLYQDDGTRFYIKGIGYQQQGQVLSTDGNAFSEPATFIDPLADSAGCRRDVQHLREADINTIRVYSVDSRLNHDDCMQVFRDAGIYTIIDLSTPLNGSIDRDSPAWTTNLLSAYIATIDAFNKYENVIAYNVGNEVVIGGTGDAAPFVKSAARDVKAYLKSINSQALVGYASINAPSDFRSALAAYLTCGSDATAIDLYGLNDYQWCGDSTYTSSGYASLTSQLSSLPLNAVAYLSEFGCVDDPPRLFAEVDALLSSNMSDVWSGGVAFNYFPAQSAAGAFGMATIDRDGVSVTTNDDFSRLADRFKAARPPQTPSRSDAQNQQLKYAQCIENDDLGDASIVLPGTPNADGCKCVMEALRCRYTPSGTNYSSVVGGLIDDVCGMLDDVGGDCDDIAADGDSGVYGRLAGCDPVTKLSYIMSLYYDLDNRDASACSFGGNATVNANVHTDVIFDSPRPGRLISSLSDTTALRTFNPDDYRLPSQPSPTSSQVQPPPLDDGDEEDRDYDSDGDHYSVRASASSGADAIVLNDPSSPERIASSCISNPAATFTPSSGNSQGSGGGSGNGNGNSGGQQGNHSGASREVTVDDHTALMVGVVGVGLAALLVAGGEF